MPNPTKKFIVSAIWFFITAIAVYIAIQIWNNPLQIVEIKNELVGTLYLSALMFLTPALFFASLVSLSQRKIAITSIAMVIIHIIAFFILGTTIFKGEGGLGLMIMYGIIGVTFLISAILGAISRKLLERNEKILNWIFLIPIILIFALFTRVHAYQTPTISGCGKLDVYGQIYCYDKLARQMENPIWCYAIRAADNIKEGCVKAIQATKNIPIDPLQCQILPDDQSKLDCTVSTASQSSDVGICEQQQSARMDTCLVNVIKKNYQSSRTTDCSVLKNSNNKRMCYNYWLLFSGTASSFNKCSQIINPKEKDFCFYSYTYNTSGQGLDKICNMISDSNLRKTCLAEIK